MTGGTDVARTCVRSWRTVGLVAPGAFIALACVEAVASSWWLRIGVYVVCGPASMAIATGIYLDRRQRSAVVLTLMVLAGIGTVVLEGFADNASVVSLQLLLGVGALAVLLLLAAAAHVAAERRS